MIRFLVLFLCLFSRLTFAENLPHTCSGQENCILYHPTCLEDFESRYRLEGTLDNDSDFGMVFLVRKKGDAETDYVVKMIPVVSDKLIQFYDHSDSSTQHELEHKYKLKEKFIHYSIFKDKNGNPQDLPKDEIFVSQKLSDLVLAHEALNFPILEDVFECDFILKKQKTGLRYLQHPIPNFREMHWYYTVVKKHKMWSKILIHKEDLDKFRENQDLLLFSLRYSLYKSWEKYGFVHGDILNGTGNNLFYDLEHHKEKYIVFPFEDKFYKFEIKNQQIPLLLLFDFSFADMTQFKKFKKVPTQSVSAYPIGDSKSTEHKRTTDIQGINDVLASILGAHKDYIPQLSTTQNRDLVASFPAKAMTQHEFEEWKKTVHESEILRIVD